MLRFRQVLNLPRKGQTLSAKCKPQTVNELAAEDLPENFDGEEKGILRTNPLRVVRREPPAWNDTVEMRMEQKILSPGVQNAEEADVGAQVFGIASDLQKRLRHSPEQEVIEFDLVLENECL